MPTLDTWHREAITEIWGALLLLYNDRVLEVRLRVKLPGGQSQRLRAQHVEAALGSHLWGPFTPRVNAHRTPL